jgi:hypothetical protein
LSAGETELAVLKGVTLTGRDPRFVDAARNLDRASFVSESWRESGAPPTSCR